MDKTVSFFLGLVVLFLAVSAFIAAYSYAGSHRYTSGRTFSVTGEAMRTVTPDIAQFQFGVTSEGGKNLSSLQNENTGKMNAAIEFLKELGIAQKDIATQDYRIEPRYQYFNCPEKAGVCPPPELAGYTVTQRALVKIRDFSKIGEALAGVQDKGANSIGGLAFTVDDPSELQNQARAEAIKKAGAKAQAMAKDAGFKLGNIITIGEGSIQPTPYRTYAFEALSAKGQDAPPTIEPGLQEIKVTVTLQYEIK